MASYRLVNRAGHFQQVHTFDCPGDDIAIKHAHHLTGDKRAELWNLNRLVALFGADRVRPAGWRPYRKPVSDIASIPGTRSRA